jgi:hypothetical protein
VALAVAFAGGGQDEALSEAVTDEIITVLALAPLRPGDGGGDPDRHSPYSSSRLR